MVRLKLKADKKDGIVPYQSQISLKNKKVQKRPSQTKNADVFDHYLHSKEQAQSKINGRVMEIRAKEERKSPKKMKKRKNSLPLHEEPVKTPKKKAALGEECQKEQTSNESLHQSAPPQAMTVLASDRIYEANTDLCSVMPEMTMEREKEQVFPDN